MTPKLHKVTKCDKIGKKVSFYNDLHDRCGDSKNRAYRSIYYIKR